MTDKTAPPGHELAEKKIHLHHQNPLLSSKSGWGLVSAVEMGIRSLGAQHFKCSGDLQHGQEGLLQEITDAGGVICIRVRSPL